MSYHDLSECTLTPEERLNEADEIAQMLIQECSEKLNENEAEFVHRMDTASYVSVKQLFWLRDLKDKYL